MTYVPHGTRRCEDCTFYHPEKMRKRCSAFGEPENRQGDCSLYDTLGKAEKRLRLLQAQRDIQHELLMMDGEQGQPRQDNEPTR